MRAFLAVPLMPEDGGVVGALQESLASMPALEEFRWIPPSNVHLTLRFLGEIDEDEAERAGGALEAAAGGAEGFELLLERFGVFPHLRSPNVLWAGPVACPPALEAFVRRLSGGLSRAGLPAADRPFKPHLTIGRRRGRGRPPGGLEGELVAAEHRWLSPPLRLRMEEAVLFRSELRPGGAIYAPIRRAPLA
ncbi:MAG: RNA 2',3'-cyclic phosphodiesterase [Nitrospinota bacterium]